jgi:hypothetical protein
MNDVRFNQALNIVLMLNQRGCLKHGVDQKEDQQLSKHCNRQIQAILIIYEWLVQLYPEKPEEKLKLKAQPNDRWCPHCGHHDIN